MFAAQLFDTLWFSVSVPISSILNNSPRSSQKKQEDPKHAMSHTQTMTAKFVEAKTAIPSFPEPVLNSIKKLQDYRFVKSTPSKGNSVDHTAKEQSQSQSSVLQQAVPLKKDNSKSHFGAKCPPQKDLDPLSTFIMLRSQQSPAVTATPAPSSAVIPGTWFNKWNIYKNILGDTLFFCITITVVNIQVNNAEQN